MDENDNEDDNEDENDNESDNDGGDDVATMGDGAVETIVRGKEGMGVRNKLGGSVGKTVVCFAHASTKFISYSHSLLTSVDCLNYIITHCSHIITTIIIIVTFILIIILIFIETE